MIEFLNGIINVLNNKYFQLMLGIIGLILAVDNFMNKSYMLSLIYLVVSILYILSFVGVIKIVVNHLN